MPINYANLSNENIHNAIRRLMPQDYQNRVPLATKDNMELTANAIAEYDPTFNSYLNVLLNKIVLQIINTTYWENPLKSFKGGKLQYGETMEQIHVNIARAIAKESDPDEAVWKRTIPDVSTIYHTVNRKDKYPVTINHQELQYAMLREGGMNNLIAEITQSLYNGDEQDEFLIMKNQLSMYKANKYFYPIQVANPVDEYTAKEAIIEIRKTSNDMLFLKRHFNSMGVDTLTKRENQLILLKTDFDARTSVDVLAKAFNMSETEFLSKSLLLDDFGADTEDVIAIMVDKRFWVQRDTDYSLESIWNPSKKYWNLWLHHAGMYSVNRFANAVAFITKPVSVTGVTVEASPSATVSAGSRLSMKATVVGGADSYVPQSVMFEIIGELTDPDTFIDAAGVLHVGRRETATTVTVIATSTYNRNVFGTKDVTVKTISRPAVTSVTIDPDSPTVEKNSDTQFTAIVTGTGGLNDLRATFKLNGAPVDSYITSNGLLHVGENETVASFKIVATSVFDNKKSGNTTITVNV